MMRISFIVLLLLLTSLHSFAQSDDYTYKREISGIDKNWHKIVLPNAIFAKSNSNLNDLRILGVTTKSDTIEAPYLLNVSQKKVNSKKVNFDIINQSITSNGRYFTFKTDVNEPINQILLDFVAANFDWRIKLEGSHNQQEWFTILDKYRIVAIKNNSTNYKYSKLLFPDANYTYYRVFVNNRGKSYLKKASILLNSKSKLKQRSYSITKTAIKTIKETNETQIDLTLDSKVPVSFIALTFKDKFDYYRPIHIEYLSDSIQTENGWKHQYKNLTSATITSFEQNAFSFKSTQLQKLRIKIQNNDNQPLSLDSLSVKGYIYELYARFNNTDASYYLAYGNQQATTPQYDLKHIAKNIPDELIALQLGTEQVIEKAIKNKKKALFDNKNWLWGIMSIIILVLGWFSINMMRNT